MLPQRGVAEEVGQRTLCPHMFRNRLRCMRPCREEIPQRGLMAPVPSEDELQEFIACVFSGLQGEEIHCHRHQGDSEEESLEAAEKFNMASDPVGHVRLDVQLSILPLSQYATRISGVDVRHRTHLLWQIDGHFTPLFHELSVKPVL